MSPTSMKTLILGLLAEKDMYGYEMINTLAQKSNDIFNLKAGTLYPILHDLEQAGMVKSYERKADNGRIRKYYQLNSTGKKLLIEKHQKWLEYSSVINKILNGGLNYATR